MFTDVLRAVRLAGRGWIYPRGSYPGTITGRIYGRGWTYTNRGISISRDPRGGRFQGGRAGVRGSGIAGKKDQWKDPQSIGNDRGTGET